MAEAKDALFDALKEAEGRPRIAALERAVRLADLEGNEELRYVARVKLMSAALSGGEVEKAIAALAWCIPVYEKDPEERRRGLMIEVADRKVRGALGYNFLTGFRGLVGALYILPQVDRPRVDAAFEQAERLHAPFPDLLGYLRHERAVSLRWMGDEAAGREAERLWREAWRTADLSGPACTPCKELPLHVVDRDWEACGRIADGVLGERLGKGCRKLLPLVSVRLFLPLCFLGRHEDAARLYPGVVRAIRERSLSYSFTGLVIEFLAATGRFEAAWKLAKEAASAYRMRVVRFRFLKSIGHLLAAAVAHGGPSRFPGPFPGEPEVLDSGGETRTAWLAERVDEELDRLGRAYDERNGNDFWTMWAAREREELLASFRPVPVPA